MATDGRLWQAEVVSAERPLAAMLDEALALLALHPGADFTFSTRRASEVMAEPFDRVSDLALEMGGLTVNLLVPIGERSWRLLVKDADAWMRSVDTCDAADVHDFLRGHPADIGMIESGMAGPLEVWLRREWDAASVLHRPIHRAAGNVVPMVRKASTMSFNAANGHGDG